jgi:hypothetical protein
MSSQHSVFVHGSVNLSMDAAADFMTRLRASTKAQSAELKSKLALAPKHRAALLDALSTIEPNGNINLVEKSYYAAARLVELLFAEHAHSYGLDVGGSGLGRDLLDYFHAHGSSAVGPAAWTTLLASFNELIRSYSREGARAPSTTPFFDALEVARDACTDRRVQDMLDDLWDARHFAAEYEGSTPTVVREMDPMASTLASVARTWRMRLGEVPFEFVADNYSGLTSERRKAIVEAARAPLAVAGFDLPRPDLRGIRLTDSRDDARVQVADILSGVGREIARLAHGGTFDDDLQVLVHEMLDYNVMCSTGSPIDELVERRPLNYVSAWWAQAGN